jgi:hypothetical protein
MGKHIAIVVDWFGPYTTIKAASEAAKADFRAGLYMCIGKVAHQKSPSRLQYVGISSELWKRVGPAHTTLQKVSQFRLIWLGEIATVGVPGRKQKVTDVCLDLAEWAHAYFLRLPLNSQKTAYPPDKPVTVLNRWWRKNLTPRNNRPHPEWPDIIDFAGKEYGARVGRLGGKIARWAPEHF